MRRHKHARDARGCEFIQQLSELLSEPFRSHSRRQRFILTVADERNGRLFGPNVFDHSKVADLGSIEDAARISEDRVPVPAKISKRDFPLAERRCESRFEMLKQLSPLKECRADKDDVVPVLKLEWCGSSLRSNNRRRICLWSLYSQTIARFVSDRFALRPVAVIEIRLLPSNRRHRWSCLPSAADRP